MDIAASVVGFAGISGQILQGCNYLGTFFSDVRDAPNVLVAISTELSTLQGRIEGFQLLLQEMQIISPSSLVVQQDPGAALQKCKDAIQNLRKFVDKCAALATPAGAQMGSSQASLDMVRKTWYKLAVARKSDKLRYHKSQLEAAKASLLGAQANIQHALQLQHLNMSREVHRDLGRLQEKHDASVQAMKDTRALATNTHTLQEEHRLLTTATNTSLDRVVADHQILLARSAVSEQSAHELRTASTVAQEAIASLSTDFTRHFEKLPTALAPIIQKSIVECLAKHDASGFTAPTSTGKTSMSPKICEVNSDNDDTCSLPIRTISGTKPLRCEGSSSERVFNPSLARQGSALRASNFLHPELLIKRGPKRQRRRISTFNLWFAQLEITTSLTEQEDDPGSDYLPPMHLEAKRTTFKLIPSLQFLRIGFLYESGQSLPTRSHPGWDNHMRVFRTHQWISSVREAIWDADLFRFRQLLDCQKITPFDHIEDFRGGSRSLFEMVTMAFDGILGYSDNFDLYLKKRQLGLARLCELARLLELARMLADIGVDCGSGESLYWTLTAISLPREQGDEATKDLRASLFRIIIAHSQSDPLDGLMGNSKELDYPSNLHQLSLIGKQDVWDISEYKICFEQYCGKGSFQQIFQNGMSYENWSDSLKQRWRHEPVSLRRSRDRCLAAGYGEEFLVHDWPELCWSEETPTFWQSRETCEKVFGEVFVEDPWPSLYWEEELPSFWRSKEACQKSFGSFFVNYRWPDLYWKQELPTFWDSRSTCLEEFGNWFAEYEWPRRLGKSCYEFLEGKGSWLRRRDCPRDMKWDEWVDQMTDRWRKDVVALAHSRQHCIDQYGTHFVQEQLPSLLRENELPEEDVLRLTAYGPDMDPPPPRPDLTYLRNCLDIERVEWATQESEHDSDSGSEDSEDWETANEDSA